MSLAELARWNAARAASALAEQAPNLASPAPADPALAECVADLLRVGEIAWHHARAAGSSPGPDGEPARRALRAVAGAYLERATREEAAELAERARRELARGVDSTVALARASDPEMRVVLWQSWLRAEDALAGSREVLAAAQDAAARRAGAASRVDLLARAEPIPHGTVHEDFRRGAIEPLDDAVLSAAAERARRRQARSGPAEAADAPRLATLVDHARHWPAGQIPSVLRRLGTALGSDPDADGPRLAPGHGPGPWATVWVVPGGPRALWLSGALDGPLALARGLGAFGRAARASFLEAIGPDAARWADPGFSHAADTLFRRLPLSAAFRAWIGMPAASAWLADLRLEEALAPRIVWAYLSLMVEHEARTDRSSASAAGNEAFRRSSGRSATPAETDAARLAEPGRASELRGTVLGLLVEERLATRFGHEWFRAPAAGRWLRDAWEAEPQETVESMAAALGLGTIDSTPVLDRCRP